MKSRVLALFCVLSLLSGCLSQKAPPREHYFIPPLSEPAGSSVSGTKPLRLDRVQAPPFLSVRMLWRLSETELAIDDRNSWAVHPAEVFEQRLRDRLFSRAGYRESLRVGDPTLTVRVVTIEGVVDGEARARVRLIADFWDADGNHHRERFESEQAIDSTEPEALADGMSEAMDRATSMVVEWIGERG